MITVCKGWWLFLLSSLKFEQESPWLTLCPFPWSSLAFSTCSIAQSRPCQFDALGTCPSALLPANTIPAYFHTFANIQQLSLYICIVCTFLVSTNDFIYSQDSLSLLFYYTVQIYVHTLYLAWGGITMCHVDFILFQRGIFMNKFVGYQASGSTFFWKPEILWDQKCWQTVRGFMGQTVRWA